MAERLVCITDDMTGALDVGGSLHTRGYDARVYPQPTLPLRFEKSAQIYNLRTRYATHGEAKTSTTDALEEIKSSMPGAVIFGKVDSTLRGPVFQTIDLLHNHFPQQHVFFAPAFPHAQRICSNGNYYVEGKPVTTTEYAQDHTFQMKTDRLTNGRKDITHININDIRKGPEHLYRLIKQSHASLFSFDTLCQEDLQVIAYLGMQINAIMVGSSGLARAMPKVGSHPPHGDFDDSDPFMFVLGSQNPKSRTQLSRLERDGVQIIQLLINDVANLNSIEAVQSVVGDLLTRGHSCAIATPQKQVQGCETYHHDLDQTVANICDSPIKHHLVLTGGETAASILISRGVTYLDVVDEHAPGIPIAIRSNDTTHRIITKAGGFGKLDEYRTIYEYHKP